VEAHGDLFVAIDIQFPDSQQITPAIQQILIRTLPQPTPPPPPPPLPPTSTSTTSAGSGPPSSVQNIDVKNDGNNVVNCPEGTQMEPKGVLKGVVNMKLEIMDKSDVAQILQQSPQHQQHHQSHTFQQFHQQQCRQM
jgi:hypothetical protein